MENVTQYQTGAALFPIGGASNSWVYHSENWTKVVDRWEHRRLLQDGKSISVLDNVEAPPSNVVCTEDKISVCTFPDGSDRWVYFYINPSEFIWQNFVWSFVVRRKSMFRELQFGFRYRDFYNRYRFRHEGNVVFFDKVDNGRFYHAIHQNAFPMELGRDYLFVIRAQGRSFCLEIDGKMVLRAFDPENTFPCGSIAVILWEDDGVTPISADISDIRVTSLNEI